MPGRFAVILLALHFLLPLGLWAQPAQTSETRADPFSFGISDVRRYFAWGWNMIPTGLDVTASYRIPPWFSGVDTILEATIGGGYEGLATFRTWDYIPHTVAADTAAAEGYLEFNSPNFQWQAGIRQGILWNPDKAENLLEAFLFYRGRYERYLNGRYFWGSSDSQIAAIRASHEAWQSSYLGSDARGIFGTSLFAGLAYDDLHFNWRTKAYDGFYTEGSLEISPYFPSVLGASDFWRLNATAKYSKTLYESPRETEKNWFTLYLSGILAIDYADALRQMPLYVMETLGGTEPRVGLAYAVRGFEKYSWDTQLKIVHNLDLRLNLPVFYSIFGRDLLPGVVVYFDLGYGDHYWGDPTDTPGGFLASSGIGTYLGLLDLAYVHLYFHVPLINHRIDRAPWVVDLDLGLQF
jgi:hypothetical protein